jgi:hypothetical protein
MLVIPVVPVEVVPVEIDEAPGSTSFAIPPGIFVYRVGAAA